MTEPKQMKASEFVAKYGDMDNDRPTFELPEFSNKVLARLTNNGSIRLSKDLPNLLSLTEAKALANWILEVCD